MQTFDFENFDQTQFEGKDRYEQNLEMQKLLVKQVLKFFPEESKPSQVDFFFYTDSEDKAVALSKELKKISYEVHVSQTKRGEWAICGCTNEMEIKNGVIEKWAEQMCTMGFKNDCRFDGWGTIV